MQGKQNYFGVKYEDGENKTGEGINNIKKSYKDTKKDLRQKYTSVYSGQHSKEVPNWKTPVHDGINEFWF